MGTHTATSLNPNKFLFYFTAVGVKCRVAAVKHPPILLLSADFFFFFLLPLGSLSHVCYFENRIPLKPVPVGRMQPCKYIAAYEET